MIDLDNLKIYQKVILNAILVALITMFSVYAVNPFSISVIYSGLMSGLLSFFVQLKTLTDSGNLGASPKILCLL